MIFSDISRYFSYIMYFQIYWHIYFSHIRYFQIYWHIYFSYIVYFQIHSTNIHQHLANLWFSASGWQVGKFPSAGAYISAKNKQREVLLLSKYQIVEIREIQKLLSKHSHIRVHIWSHIIEEDICGSRISVQYIRDYKILQSMMCSNQ